MRLKSTENFAGTFDGEKGRYQIEFVADDDWDGEIAVAIGPERLRWFVNTIERDEQGQLALSGLTTGTDAIWGDVFWFLLNPETKPASISYWGDRILARTDFGVVSKSVR